MATCGNCGKTGATVAEIKRCYLARMRDAESGGAPGVFKLTGENSLHQLVAKVEITEGFWKLPDGGIYKVQRAVHGSGMLYAKKLTLTTVPAEGGGTQIIGSFDYAPGEFARLEREGAHEVTAEEASLFGQLYGFCVFCTKTLTDERSQYVGYGKKCAQNQGLPWGERPDTIISTSEGVES